MKNSVLYLVNFLFFLFFLTGVRAQSEFVMLITNQETVNAFDTVCILHLDTKTGNPTYGYPGRSIERRKLRIGESVIVKNGIVSEFPNGTRIYSQKFRTSPTWNSEKIANWAKSVENRRKVFDSTTKGATSRLSGFVLSADTLAPVGAKITLFSSDGKFSVELESLASSGEYSITIPQGKYSYEITSANFLFNTGEIEISSDGYREFFLERIKEGNKVVLKNIFFEFGKANLLPESFAQLSSLGQFMKDWPDMEIEISGHTDNKGSEKYNQALSEKRAKAVVDYLVEHGITPERLSYKGFGFLDPVAPNQNPDGSDNPEGRQENRRTEFMITKVL